MALVIHRAWSSLGLRLWGWVGWFITFNFLNISWVFFRAKEWDDAIKVLSAMFSVENIMLPEKLAGKLASLGQYGVTFGDWTKNIMGSTETFVWIFVGFIMVLLFRNSTEKIKSFELNGKTAIIASIAFVAAILSLNKVSEFLYFNF